MLFLYMLLVFALNIKEYYNISYNYMMSNSRGN